MSLLSATRGNPPQLLALLRLLRTAGGTMHRDELKTWLQPDGNEYKGSLLEGTVGAASSLDFVKTEGSQVTLLYDGSLETQHKLSDAVHARLRDCTEYDADRIIFQTFAWFAVECDRRGGTAWISEKNTGDLADEIDKVLRVGEENREERYFNTTKYPGWRRWIEFTGLGTTLSRVTEFYPYVVERLSRELQEIGRELGYDQEIDIEQLLPIVARRMPYLDRGRVFLTICRKSAWSPPDDQISYLLSNGLRELHELGSLKLSSPGDAKGVKALAPDHTSALRTVKAISIIRGVV